MAVPRSIWSRALRTQLVRQQLPRTGAHLPVKFLISQRLYSTANTGENQSIAHHESETSPESASQHERISKAVSNQWSPQRIWEEQFVQRKANNAKENEDLMRIAQGIITPEKQDGSKKSVTALKKELEWLKDPLAMANRVARFLQQEDPASAAILVREAQKEGISTSVAWNHLIFYCMEKGLWQPALKFYHDMKKRGAKPNSMTFTILLHGLRHIPPSKKKTPEIIQTAETIYRSLFASNSPVEPSIIHVNAMLTVCQWHSDTDSLWRIAGDLPEEGPLSPDMITYTIILGSIHFAAEEHIKHIGTTDAKRVFARKAQMIQDGKRVWADVLYRWTKDQVPIDNGVVNAMAGLLLSGMTDGDMYEVLCLYHQTMGIPILAARPEQTSRSTPHFLRRRRGFGDKVYDVPFVMDEEAQKGAEQPKEEDEENFDSLFDPIVPGDESLSFLKPSNPELTTIIDACRKMNQATAAGHAYWNHLTLEETPHRIDVDAVSITMYLRLLRESRSSKKAVHLMRDQVVPFGKATKKEFEIAMNACRRDKKNRSALWHANELMEMMDKALVLPTPRALSSYLKLVQSLSDEPALLHHMKDLVPEATTKAKNAPSLKVLGKQMHFYLRLSAINTLRPHILRLHEALEGSSTTRRPKTPLPNAEVSGEEALQVMQWTRLLIDHTLTPNFKEFLKKKERQLLESESRMLSKYSDERVIHKLSGIPVYPTIEQRNIFLERRTELFESSQAEKPAGETPEREEQSLSDKQADSSSA